MSDAPGSGNVELVERFYAARARNDRAAIRSILHPDIAWHDPYPPPHGGDLKGIESVLREIFDRAGELTGGSTRLTLRETIATNEYVAAVVTWESTLRGETMSGTELAVYHVTDAQITGAWFYPDNKSATDHFFASEAAPAR
jgi:ketosteroid isomerase-like protein